MTRWVVALALLLAPIGAYAQDEKVLRKVTPEQIEALLKSEKIEFQKSSTPKKDVHFYDFERRTHRLRLTVYSTQDLMLDSAYKGLPLDKVNAWNRLAKFSRASLHQDKEGDFVLLEYNLDLAGGFTSDTLKQFLNRFEEELAGYEKFANPPIDSKVLETITVESLEKLLNGMKLTFKKKVGGSGATAFDFEAEGQKVRLYYRGPKLLTIDSITKSIPLERVNEFNLSRKFIRVVNRGEGEKGYTALEATLDCEAGVTAGMVRHFIESFSEDAKSFADFARQERAAQK